MSDPKLQTPNALDKSLGNLIVTILEPFKDNILGCIKGTLFLTLLLALLQGTLMRGSISKRVRGVLNPKPPYA